MDNYFKTRFVFHQQRTKVWKAICEFIQKEIDKESVLLELGPGYCDFINQINVKKKYAIDINPEVKKYCKEDVVFINSPVTIIPLEEHSVDVIFASNVLEHLTDEELKVLFQQINRVLKTNGLIILLQPNYYYCYREYWDDYTHVKAFSHSSLCDFLKNNQFSIQKMIKKFLPYSFYSPFPKSYLITKIYLALPFRPFAKQMLVIAKKSN